MFFKKNKKQNCEKLAIDKAKRCASDEISWDVANGFADFGDYTITNLEVAKAARDRIKSLRPDAKKLTFEEVVAEAVTAFDILAFNKDQALKK